MSTSLTDEEELERVFKRFDENGDGKISAAEFGKVIRALGSKVSDSQVSSMIEEMDSDGDGFVDLKEFVEFHKKKERGGKCDDVEAELKDAFDMYDLNKNGLISATELHKVLKQLGDMSSVDDCSRMIGSLDSDGDGCVNFEEFKKMLNNGKRQN